MVMLCPFEIAIAQCHALQVNTMLLRTNHILKSAGSGCDGHAATKFDVAGVSIQMMEVASKAEFKREPRIP